MDIQWTPWFNVPMHRRLELFSVAFMIFLAIGFPILSSIFLLYLLCVGNIYIKALCLLYLAFVYYDRNCADRGGRGAGITWLRELSVWKYCVNYFPLNLVKTAELPADRNYLLIFIPHGILSLGTLVTCITPHSKWSELFPKIRSKCCTLNVNTIFPISRELVLSFGACSASANSLTTLMKQSNDPKHESNRDGYTSNAAALIVGGAQESFYAVSNTYKSLIKKRKGFCKIAIKTGASLVPAISFGENNLYTIIKHEPGSWGRFFQDKFKQITTLAPVHFNGRGIFQYDFGLIPKRQKLNVVIGAPMHVEKNSNPTAQDIDKVHELFCDKLIELFETHKSKYVDNSENVQLEFV